MQPSLNLERYLGAADRSDPIRVNGTVTEVAGLAIIGHGPGSSIGSLCEISTEAGHTLEAEVVGFREGKIILMPLGDTQGLGPGARIVHKGRIATVPVGRAMLGRVFDGLGQPYDDKGSFRSDTEWPIYAKPINPLKRARIREPLDVGVRAINGLLTVGKGQRMGIFAGSGVGKSTLLGMMARKTKADVSVVALVGERGREVREFIDKSLGEEGMKRSVIVVATSDQPPLIRIRAAFAAMSIAEYFRSVGADVLLLLDSITRFAMAQREVGLVVGEPPTSRGYTPSVFSMFPRILERAGTWDKPGSITGFFTILVEQDDVNDPIGDAVRAILDGHIVLARGLAARNHYPSIDVLQSVSRTMIDCVPREQMLLAKRLFGVLSDYREAEDLINIGAYARGSNPKIDAALAYIDRVNQYLQQEVDADITYTDSIELLKRIFSKQ
ncbi:MAG: FliI/YscN family ATPase [Nitrospirae bacterium]|nr:FliI/YscN family ATPase [Nitrospirota bacterium]